MGRFAERERERYRVIVERSGDNDDMTMEIESGPTELPSVVGDAIAGLTHCDVIAYRLDEDGNRVGKPAYEERIEGPYEDERELSSTDSPH
jgi:hypothetical protein